VVRRRQGEARREPDRLGRDDGAGGDNRTGCAVPVTLVETLLKHKLPHPPLSPLFAVRGSRRRYRGRASRRRGHRGLLPRPLRRDVSMHEPGHSRTASVSGAAKGSTGRPVPLLTEFLIRRAGGKAG
jgi:hypothetical protein